MKNTYFQYWETVHEQTEDLAMGSPVSPTFSKYTHMEELTFGSEHTSQSLFLERYVDDAFAIIRSHAHSHFLQSPNSLQLGVFRFTHETEKNTLPYLEILVSRIDDSIYHKPTHTDQLLNFNSHHPVSFKGSVMSTLTNRCNTIPSTIMAKKQEVQHLKFYTANSYS